MSNGFEDRKKGQENKFAHDAEMEFKAMARRNKLLGLWVAETFLGKTGDDAEAFAKEVVASDFDRPGDDDVVEFVLKSVEGKDADLSEHRLRARMEELMHTALEQVRSEA